MITTKDVMKRSRQYELMNEINQRFKDNVKNIPVHAYKKSQYITSVLPTNVWKDRRCFIIGGGKTAKHFNYSLLKDELVIGINRAYELIDPTVMYFSDTRFWGWAEQGMFGAESSRKYTESKAIKVALDYCKFPYPEDVYVVQSLNGIGLSKVLSDGIYAGTDSGFAAINLAIALGCNEIFLVGFDFKSETDKQENFHDGYPEKMDSVIYKDMVEAHSELANIVGMSTDVRIWNLNENSALRTYPFLSKEAVEDMVNVKEFDVFIRAYYGIGDNFYTRPFIKEMVKKYRTVYLETCLPQLYYDIKNIKFVFPDAMNLRCQNKIVRNLPEDTWVEKPKDIRSIEMPSYWNGFRMGLNVKEYFDLFYPCDNYDFKFKCPTQWIEEAKVLRDKIMKRYPGKKLCIVRQPTVRNEWKHSSRAPEPKYYKEAYDVIKKDYVTVSIADIEKGKEEFYKNEKANSDVEYHRGQLSIEMILGLIQIADLVLCCNSFYLVAGIAMDTPTFCIWGGSIPHDILVYDAMKLGNYETVIPDNFCGCLEHNHDCDKTINVETLRSKLSKFISRKKRLLLSRIPPEKAIEIAKNDFIAKDYDVYVMEQSRFMVGYENNKHWFAELIPFIAGNDDVAFNYVLDTLSEYRFDHVIISQPLFYQADMTEQACRLLGIKHTMVENYFDDKLIYDSRGVHYKPVNDIVAYVENYRPQGKWNLPKTTRQVQGAYINKEELYSKYELSSKDKIVVLFGQVPGDMSLKFSVNPEVHNYDQYLYWLIKENQDVTFLFKHHPQQSVNSPWINSKNVKIIDEGIHTLFQHFDLFTAFSSTVIFEGMAYYGSRIKFATCGYHLLNDPALVYQLDNNYAFKGLYEHLSKFKVDEAKLSKYVDFITNKYTIAHSSEQLKRKIELSPELYYQH